MEYSTKSFEKFGYTFKIDIQTETHPLWVTQVKDPQGNLIDTNTDSVRQQIQNGTLKPVIDWVDTGDTLSSSFVTDAWFSDYTGLIDAKIALLTLPDGPVTGIVDYTRASDGTVRLLDPCLVIYNGTRIDLRPIFNVGRYIDIARSAVRAEQAPCEMILAAYPGFILQNRMFKYQLKPAVAFSSSPEVTNLATELV